MPEVCPMDKHFRPFAAFSEDCRRLPEIPEAIFRTYNCSYATQRPTPENYSKHDNWDVAEYGTVFFTSLLFRAGIKPLYTTKAFRRVLPNWMLEDFWSILGSCPGVSAHGPPFWAHRTLGRRWLVKKKAFLILESVAEYENTYIHTYIHTSM